VLWLARPPADAAYQPAQTIHPPGPATAGARRRAARQRRTRSDLNGPRTSTGASGLGSKVSNCAPAAERNRPDHRLRLPGIPGRRSAAAASGKPQPQQAGAAGQEHFAARQSGACSLRVAKDSEHHGASRSANRGSVYSGMVSPSVTRCHGCVSVRNLPLPREGAIFHG